MWVLMAEGYRGTHCSWPDLSGWVPAAWWGHPAAAPGGGWWREHRGRCCGTCPEHRNLRVINATTKKSRQGRVLYRLILMVITLPCCVQSAHCLVIALNVFSSSSSSSSSLSSSSSSLSSSPTSTLVSDHCHRPGHGYEQHHHQQEHNTLF